MISKANAYFVLWDIFKAFQLLLSGSESFFHNLWFAVALGWAANLPPESHKQVGDILDIWSNLSVLPDSLYLGDHCCVEEPWPYAEGRGPVWNTAEIWLCKRKIQMFCVMLSETWFWVIDACLNWGVQMAAKWWCFEFAGVYYFKPSLFKVWNRY